MDVQINITKNLKNQFEHYFKLELNEGEYFLNPSIGGGKGMEFLDFPGQMEFYHFKKSYFKVPINMKSINPVNSNWFLIHINLAKTKQNKTTINEKIEFQKHLPIGILLYGSELEIDTQLPPNIEMELVSIRFSHHFLETYFDDWKSIIDITKNLVYEDLDYKLENAIYKALSTMKNKMACHASVLLFMNLFLEKLSRHSKSTNHKELHTKDVKSLFAASVHLRNPIAQSTPTIDELASIAKMSKTKFKTTFKQLFGSAPLQYRNKIRMEFAREELISNRKTPSEISHELGYSHPSNFTTTYKKYFDELPSSHV